MKRSEKQHATFWNALAHAAALGACRPMVDCLAEAERAVADTPMAAVCQEIVRRILAGATLSQAMRELPEAFDERVVAAVAGGEADGVLHARIGQIAAAVQAGSLAPLEAAAAGGAPDAEATGIIDHFNAMVLQATRARASDIHLDPTEDGRGCVRFRVDGVLHEKDPAPAGMYAKLVDRIKILANMDASERRLPQDGRIMTRLGGQPYDLRVSSCPALWGERIVCRILARQNVQLDVERLGFSGADAATLRRLSHLPSGLVIVNGPTGCGKTTILYSMVMTIDRQAQCVISIEDPVEVALEGVAQIQIHPAIGRTFARCIRSAFRQDPDVIVVGELRDLEMIELCVQAAMTGHLVLTTLHAQTCVGAIRRLIDCGLEPFMANSTVEGVITPRLVRMLCPKCRRRAEPAPHSLSAQAAEIIAALKAPTFFEPVGCPDCAGTGYRGRTTVNEVLVPDDRFRQSVVKPLDMAALHAAALAAGMKPMLADGLEKAARGVTSIREVLRTVPPAAEWR